jgi:hypothetical protein
MKIDELQPRFITPELLVFLCPHCKGILLAVKTITMKHKDQREIFEKEFGEDWNHKVVWDEPDKNWTISGTLPTISITPSIDASKSGHWHGFVTNGIITP